MISSHRSFFCHTGRFLAVAFAALQLTACADMWHEIRYGNNDAPVGAAVPIEDEPAKALTREEKLNLLTQKLIMQMSMKGLEGIRLKRFDDSEDCRKIFASLYRERIVEYGDDYVLSVHMSATPEDVRIVETESGKVALIVTLPTE